MKKAGVKDEKEKEILSNLSYHLLMREGTTENALFILFSKSLIAKIPLGLPCNLMNPNFPVPISIILGDYDWVQFVDMEDICGLSWGETLNGEQWGEKIVFENSLTHGDKSKFYWCPHAGHNMHSDNETGLIEIIESDLKYLFK